MKNIMPSSKLDFNADFMVIEGQNQILIGRDILRRLGLMADNSMVIHVNNSNSSQEIDDCFDHLNLPLIAESTCEPHSNDWKHCIKFQFDDTDKDQILKTLEKFPEVWSSQFPEDGIVCAPMPIEFTDESKVVCFPPRPLCPRKLKIANEYFDDLIARKIARESTSSFRSPIVLIEYENKKPRIAGDYSGAKGINSLTKTIPASLPRLSDVHEVLAKANYICLINLPQAFYQLKLREDDIAKTAVGIPGRCIEFIRASFGLKNVPTYFQQVMSKIFAMEGVWIYLDDLIITGESLDQLVSQLTSVLANAQLHLSYKDNLYYF
ncbi:hypothetical protein RCL1_008329 [Eukaryota sp. TZLM3-RCL]